METRAYIAQVQSQLVAAAALGDETVREVASALVAAAEPALRLALLAAVTHVADEVTMALLDTPQAPAVSARLDGDEIRIEVRTLERAEPSLEPADEDNSARISLRLSEALKSKIEEVARIDALSVNSWLVRAATRALAERAAPHGRGGTPSTSPQRLSGWING